MGTVTCLGGDLFKGDLLRICCSKEGAYLKEGLIRGGGLIQGLPVLYLLHSDAVLHPGPSLKLSLRG